MRYPFATPEPLRHARPCRLVSALSAVVLGMGMPGCASYYTHYGKLDVTTAGAAERELALTWESGETPGGFGGRDTTPISLSTQCSERVLLFREADDPGRSCAPGQPGIFWCGDPALDLQPGGQKPAGKDMICGSITDDAGATRIGALKRRVKVVLRCWPAVTSVGSGEDAVNMDLPRASASAYPFVIRKLDRGSLDLPRPLLSDRGCKP